MENIQKGQQFRLGSVSPRFSEEMYFYFSSPEKNHNGRDEKVYAQKSNLPIQK
jgi:hypothetical protein